MEEKRGDDRDDGRRGSTAEDHGDHDHEFIQWLATIHDEIDATADTLKDEVNIVKVRRITPNLEILKNELRAGNGRARTNAVMGLDDAVAKAIKNLQILRTNLKEESQQLVNLPIDRTEAAPQKMFCSNQAIPPGASANNGSNVVDASKAKTKYLQNKPRSPSSASPLESSRGGTETENRVLSEGIGRERYEDDTPGSSGGGDSNAAASDFETLTESLGGHGEVEVTPPSVPVPEPVAGCSSSNARNDGPVSKYQKANEIGFEGCHDARSSPLSVIPSSNDQDPRDLLSAECWQLVFDKVDDPQDWLNLYRTSSYFQEVVGDKRTTALFAQVARDVIPHLGQNLNEILGLRLVCRSWKAGVDHLLETPAPDVVSARALIQRQLEPPYSLHSAESISSFLEQFEAHSRNPFVGRFISFKCDYFRKLEVIEEYCLLVTRLLNKFGSQVKTLRIEVHDKNSNNCEPELQSFLQLTPNLVSLRVRVHFRQYAYSSRRQGGVLVRSVELGRPLPHLPNLKSISFYEASVLPERRHFLKLQNAVVRLSCNPNILKSVEIIGFPSELLAYPSVESAVVSFQAKDDYSNLARTSWPLSNLSVRDLSSDHTTLFECVEHFKASLTSLHFPRGSCPNRSFKLKLDLPHLKLLTIHWKESMSLEYLVNLGNLEVLSILYSRHFLGPPDVNRSFVEWAQAEVVRCGLWERLPKLTKICLIGPFGPTPGREGFSSAVLLVSYRNSRTDFQRQENQLYYKNFQSDKSIFKLYHKLI